MPMLDEEGARTRAASAPPLGAGTPPASTWLRYQDSPYLIGERIAAGGMGTVHLGLKKGGLGFRRLVAIKRLHAHLAVEPDFVARFKDEIHLVSRLNHPNVVQTLDVLESADELALVMEYVEGVTLHQLLRDASQANAQLPIPVAVGVVAQALHGLHAAHELVDDNGCALQLVHRDFSPQNILIAREGVVKVLDFGVAKASSELHVTKTGHLSGKAPYMAPEQVLGNSVDRRTDVFAAGVVLWEALTCSRLFRPPGTAENVAFVNVLELRVPPPSRLRSEVDPALDRLVLRALDRDPTRRFGSARDFALALEELVKDASPSAVASGVTSFSGHRLVPHASTLATVPSVWLEAGTRQGEELLSRVDAARGLDTVVNTAPGTETRNREQATPRDAVVRPEHELLTIDVQGVPLDPAAARSSPRRRWAIAFSVLVSLGAIAAWQYSSSRAYVDGTVPGESRASAGAAASRAALRESGAVAADTKAEIQTSRSLANAPPTQQLAPSASVLPVESLPPGEAVARREARTPPRDVAPRRRTRTAVERAPRQEPTAAAKSDCSPPTYVDPDGIRHFKPECL